MQAKNGEKFLRRKGTQEQISFAFAVVDQLAADSAVHSIGSVGQIVNYDTRAIFTKAVGKNAIGDTGGAKVSNASTRRINAPQGLDGNRIRASVMNSHRDRHEIGVRVRSHRVDQVRLALESSIRHRQLHS